MAQFGKYKDKDLEKMAMELYDKLEAGNIKEEFDLVTTSDIHVKMTDKQITVDGAQSVNGIDYQPIKQRIRRYDDEDVFEILAVSYLMMKLLGEQEP